MLNIAICDDEAFFRDWIKEMLLQYMQDKGMAVYKIDTFQSARELLELGIELNQYKIIFLDINMDNIDGLMAARKIREQNKEIFIVFITAFVDYSMEGYKVDAIRFLLKSSKNMQGHIAECMDAIYKKMQYDVIWREFEFHEGKKTVSLDCLLYVESKKHRLEFHVMEDKLVTYTTYETLNNMEKYINSRQFLRCHQSFLVNIKYIEDICRYKVILYNGKDFPMPKARYKEVWNTYVSYKGEL